MLKAQHGVGWSFRPFEGNAKIGPKRRVVRPELDCLVQGLQRLIVASLTLKGRTEARKVLRRRILPDRACDPLDGVVEMIVFKGQKSHEMKRVRMIGIDGKRLLAINQCIEIALGAHMTEAGFAE